MSSARERLRALASPAAPPGSFACRDLRIWRMTFSASRRETMPADDFLCYWIPCPAFNLIGVREDRGPCWKDSRKGSTQTSKLKSATERGAYHLHADNVHNAPNPWPARFTASTAVHSSEMNALRRSSHLCGVAVPRPGLTPAFHGVGYQVIPFLFVLPISFVELLETNFNAFYSKFSDQR